MATNKEKAIYRGEVTHTNLRINSGAPLRTRLAPGETYDQYRRLKVTIGFIGDDGENYWFHAPERGIPPTGICAATDWNTRMEPGTDPQLKIKVGDRVAVSAAKKGDTAKGTQLYFVARLAADSDTGARKFADRIAALEARIAALEAAIA